MKGKRAYMYGKYAYKKDKKLEKNFLIKFLPYTFYGLAVASLVLLIYLVVLFNPVHYLYRGLKIDKNTEKVAEAKPEITGTIALDCNKEVIFKDGVANFILKNPYNFSNNLVLNLRIKVKDTVIEKLDKNLLDELQYNENEKTLSISRTDYIPPGYNLLKLDMINFQNSSYIPEGNYEGILRLQTYTYPTNDKSFVFSEFPMKVIIK